MRRKPFQFAAIFSPVLPLKTALKSALFSCEKSPSHQPVTLNFQASPLLCLLNIIAVMFTFSFGSAMADTVSNSDANMIKQATDYVKTGLPEAVQKAYKSVLTAGTANTYITEAAWEAAAADIVDELNDDIDTARDGYLNGTTQLASGWNAYDYVYAASKLYANYTYTALAEDFADNDDQFAVMAAKAQFKIDLTDEMKVYDKVDLNALYSKTEPTTGKTYYEQAAEAIATAKESLNKYFFNDKGEVINVHEDVAGLAGDIVVAKGWIEDGFAGNSTLDVDAFKGIKAEPYEGTTVAKYYYVDGIPTLDDVKVDEAIKDANAAAAKAAVQAAYARYVSQKGADKDFASDWLTVCTYLAGENILDGRKATELLDGMNYADGFKAEVAKYADAIDDVQALEAYAAKCLAEKDANGITIRDAEDVQDIVDEFTLAAYKYATGLATAKPDLGTYKGKLEVLSINTDSAKLAFDKEAEKCDLDDEMDDIIDNYYDLEAEAVKAAYTAAKAKVDAAAKTDEFADIESALDKEVKNIKKTAAVDRLFTSGKMKTELDAQVDALEAYVQYKNSAVKAYDDAHILGFETANYSPATKLLTEYYIDNNARTVAEMKALTGVVEAVAATIPTNASYAAAEKAADDAIKALPSVAATVAADKDAYQNAFDLAEAYNEMVEVVTGTAGTKAIPAAKVSALKAAIQDEINLEYAKADKLDKATLKAISDKVTALNDDVDADNLFTTDFVDPTTDALKKIRTTEFNAVKAAINAIPFTVTEADKATVVKARELYDAFVAEYTDYDINRIPAGSLEDGYVADDFDVTAILRAEAALGLNIDPADAVKGLKITARSTAKKGSITVKWTVKGEADIDGYEIWKSTKANKGYKKAFTTTKKTYKNSKGLKKGTRYYYKVRAYKVIDGGKVTSDWSNKANRKAK